MVFCSEMTDIRNDFQTRKPERHNSKKLKSHAMTVVRTVERLRTIKQMRRYLLVSYTVVCTTIRRQDGVEVIY